MNLNENNKVSARDLHSALEIKKKFPTWFATQSKRLEFTDGKDFITLREQSTGGRPSVDYELDKDNAISIAMISGGKKAGEVRKMLIDIFNQRQNLELLNAKEIAFAYKVIDCLKYIENQKEALELHKNRFIESSADKSYIYQKFNNYRNKITGWDKAKVDAELKLFLGENRKVPNKSITEKMSIMDAPEAIRIATIDLIFSKGEEATTALKFAEMIKNIVKEMEIKILRNENNLFHIQNNENTIKSLSNQTI